MSRTVTLTNESGMPLGEADIIDSHTGKGKLHKAFSVYVFDTDKTALLIQQRADNKMLFRLLWANTCCSHPFPSEEAGVAGERRLKEELGFSTPLSIGPSYVYRAEDPEGNGTEHEHVTMLIGTVDASVEVVPDPLEVAQWRWIDLETLKADMTAQPDIYAPWFHLGLPKVLSSLPPSL
jgi:isopentenyl-diphosphate delta-isomerase